MPFIDTSALDVAKIAIDPAKVASLASTANIVIPAPSLASLSSVSQLVSGQLGNVSQITALANNLPKITSNIQAAAIKAVTTIGTNALSSALKSITATFSRTPKDLAKTASGIVSGVFKNTNDPLASTITTGISSPVASNLLNKGTPSSSGFKVTSAQAGSEAISVAGSKAIAGSGAGLMTSPILSTVINRFNVDASLGADGIAKAAANSLLTSKMNGLFSSFSSAATSVTRNISGVQTLASTLGKVATSVIASSLGITKINSPGNDLSRFTSTSGSLMSALGLGSASAFYMSNPAYTLIDQDRNPVSTNGSGVDSQTANAILEIVKAVGCQPGNVNNYDSANELASLFNLGLNLASLNGMSDLVSNLLGCSHTSTAMGQQSLTTAFLSSAATQPDIAKSIITQMDSKAAVSTDFVAKSIITNPSLTAKDTGTVTSLLQQMSTTPTQALSIPAKTDSPLQVFDLSTLASAQPSFVDSILGDTTMTDYLSGYEMKLQANGSLNYV